MRCYQLQPLNFDEEQNDDDDDVFQRFLWLDTGTTSIQTMTCLISSENCDMIRFDNRVTGIDKPL